MLAPDVVLIAPYPARGGGRASGVAGYTAALARALAGEGARVEVVAPREHGEPPCSRDGDVRVRRAFSRGVRAVPAAVREAVATRAPTVHLQHEVFLYGGMSSFPGLVTALAALRAARATGVVTLHHVADSDQVEGDSTATLVGVPAPLARAALVGVQSAVRRLAEATVVHEPAFTRAVPAATVVPHGVRVAARGDGRAARERLSLRQDRLVVLCFGFIEPHKGLEVALEAAALAGEDVCLVVAGREHPRLGRVGDPYAADLRAHHGDHARFTGFVADEDAADWFVAADVALFPYPGPFSLGALTLALAHGTPALLSPELAASAGAPETMVAPREVDTLAALLGELAAQRAGNEDGEPKTFAAAAGVALVRDGDEGAGVRLAHTRSRVGGRSRLDAVRAATLAMARERSWQAVARAHLDVYASARTR